LQSIKIEAAACRAAFANSNIGDAVWCLHHETLIETLTEPAESRIAYILSNKPEHERARRLREFRPVVGPLPGEYNTAWAAYSTARAAYDTAWAAYSTARAAYNTAWAAYSTAWVAYNTARAAYAPALEAQHRAECPDSTWNGRTIFGSAS
jgi:hypothetical protein